MYDYAWAALDGDTVSPCDIAVSWHICMRMEEYQWVKLCCMRSIKRFVASRSHSVESSVSMQLSLASFPVHDHDHKRWQLLTCKKLAPNCMQ